MLRLKLTILLTVVALVISLLPVSVFAADVYLRTAATDSGTANTGTDTYVDTGIDATVTVNAGEKVLVIASFEIIEPSGTTTAGLRIALSGDEANTNSQEFLRTVTAPRAADKGIGTIVHIFTAASTGAQTYKLQHRSATSNSITTTGTIVAIPLATTTGATLNSEEKQVVAPVSPTSANTWQVVTGTTSTSGITTRVAAHLYVGVSIQSMQTTGGTVTGQWKIQYQKDGGTWTDLGYSVARTSGTNGENGLISLVALLPNQEAANYKFQLLHQATSTSFNTSRVNMVSVGLEDGTNYLDAYSVYTASTTISSSTLTAVASKSITTFASAPVFLHAQYAMHPSSTAIDASKYNLTVSESKLNSQEQRRYLSGATDYGSGGSVGLSSPLTAASSYTIALNHASDGTNTLSTDVAYLVGFVLGYATDQPPVPEWPTFVLMFLGMGLTGFYLWKRQRKIITKTS